MLASEYESDLSWSNLDVMCQNISIDRFNSSIEIGPWARLIPREYHELVVDCVKCSFLRVTQEYCLKATAQDLDIFVCQLHADLTKRLQSDAWRHGRHLIRD